MTGGLNTFALSGVIGIIDSAAEQLDLAVSSKLRCVEVRADLLRSKGLTDAELMSVVRAAKAKSLSCLFTLRHADQGGTFSAEETERVALCQQAIGAGADIIDLEHGTEASTIMLREGASMILSYHNFNAMLDASELASLTQRMEQQSPAAIKVIPTGSSLDDARTMLSWVAQANGSTRRIGFSMGEAGGVSRILAPAFGSPVTYASFGAPVAPGQVDIALLLNRYKCNAMGTDTKIVAVTGDTEKQVEDYIDVQRSANTASGASTVWVGFHTNQHDWLEEHKSILKVSEICVL